MPSISSEDKRAFSIIVLAGGCSRRLGRDKALLDWHGRPLLAHLVAQLQELSDDIVVITGPEPRYRDWLDVPIFADEIAGMGPLGGLYTGIKHARHEYGLVVACDMPLVSRAVIELLRSELEESLWALVPEVEGHRVPTLAIYHKNCISMIELLLAQGRTSVQGLLEAVPTKIVSEDRLRQADPSLRSFANLNTLEDWERFARDG